MSISSSEDVDAADSLLTKQSAVDKKDSSLDQEFSAMVLEEPIKPWYHFKGVAIAQGYNLVGQDSCHTFLDNSTGEN